MSIILDKVNFVYSEETAYQIQALKDVNLEIKDGQGSCRLIRQQNLRMVDHRAGDGDTLFLSAGKLCRSEIDTIPESYSL